MATWTPEEDKILMEFYEKTPKEEILAKLPHRNWKSIYKRSVILGLYRPKDGAWKKEEEDLLRELYPNTPKDVLTTKFPGRTWKSISWHAINILRLTRTKEVIQEEAKKTNRIHFGADYHTQTQAGKDNVKKSVQERYGVDNVFQVEKFKEEIKKTNLENLGVENPQQSPIIQEKTRKTNRRKHGVDNPFQLTDRVQAGMVEKYGHKRPLQVPEIKEKQQATNIERYGVPVPSQNEEVQKKTEDTNLSRFGFKTPFQNEGIKEKIKKTNIEKYGVPNPAQAEQIKEKARQTCLKKYGVEFTQQVKEFREKGYLTSKKNKSFSKSNEEDNFLKYLKILDPNTEPHVKHPVIGHVIDYYMPTFDLWVQYDGTYWHGKTQRINVTRQFLKIKKIMKRDHYQNKNIPNLIRFWSDDANNAIKTNKIIELISKKIKTKLIEKFIQLLQKI